MPTIRETTAEKLRTSYPDGFPSAALEDIKRIGKRGTWLQDRIALSHATWELTGYAQRVAIGDPDDREVEESPLDPQQLADDLYKVRELVHKGLQMMRATSTPAPGSGDAIVEQSILTSARAMEALLGAALVALAWLRKIALDSAKAMKTP
jgi:hypothetical protein